MFPSPLGESDPRLLSPVTYLRLPKNMGYNGFDEISGANLDDKFAIGQRR